MSLTREELHPFTLQSLTDCPPGWLTFENRFQVVKKVLGTEKALAIAQKMKKDDSRDKKIAASNKVGDSACASTSWRVTDCAIFLDKSVKASYLLSCGCRSNKWHKKCIKEYWEGTNEWKERCKEIKEIKGKDPCKEKGDQAKGSRGLRTSQSPEKVWEGQQSI
ncbi:hypothetical protein ARMGADRAFT_1029417 [Armillaria gallica]|uniref:Uncharacterized protein n=1 Tax=Armillaria gallica TaxID=47427 RepID=A0A2H3DYV0_ARMGA|nr:hypothetical protein ARMGADRAFT_1029417 [Armillaria gallica]